MKRYILIFLTALLPLALASSAMAMGGDMGMGYCGASCQGMHAGKPFGHLEMMQYRFGLTNDQADKIYRIEKDYMDRFYQNRGDAEKLKALHESKKAEMDKIFTKEQKEKMDEFMNAHHPKNMKMDKGRGMMGLKPFYHLDMLQQKLGLSNEQADRIYQTDKSYMDRYYQDRNNPDKVKAIRENHVRDIEKILTPEQKVKWNEYRKENPGNRHMMGREKNRDSEDD